MACHKLALEKHHRELIGKILEDCGKIVGKPSAKDYLMAAYLIGRGKLQRLLSSREGDAWTWQPDTSRCEYLNGKCISCEVV